VARACVAPSLTAAPRLHRSPPCSYFANRTRPILLEAARYLTPDGSPCNLERMGAGEKCFVEFTYRAAPDTLRRKYATSENSVTCPAQTCIHNPAQASGTNVRYVGCQINWPAAENAPPQSTHTADDLRRCAASWGCSW
jgi:hypothetical protein